MLRYLLLAALTTQAAADADACAAALADMANPQSKNCLLYTSPSPRDS